MKAFIEKRSNTYPERLKNFTGSRERFLELEIEAIEKEATRQEKEFDNIVTETLNKFVVDGLSGDHEAIQIHSFESIVNELRIKLNI